MITLRQDQEEVRTKLRVALRKHQSVLVFAPTGFGKTVLAAALMKMIFEAKKRVIFCVHRIDLIVQTAKTLDHFGIKYSYIASGEHYNPYHRVFIASIATLRNRLGKIPADFVIVDEAHLSIAAGWAKVANHYKDTGAVVEGSRQGAKVIGLTGSPERLDGKPLGDVWDTMVMGPSVKWLIEQGHLSRYRPFAVAGLDWSGLKKTSGNEFREADLDDLMAGKAVLNGAVKHWSKIAPNTRTIAFAPSIKTSNLLVDEFRERGIVAVHLDADTCRADRIAAFKGFAERQIAMISNVGLFCEGFDISAQTGLDVTIETVLDYAPTQSLAKHLQKNGRGLRKKPQPAVLLDLAGNFSRHGFPDDHHEWSLAGRKKEEREVENVTCPKCYFSHAPAPKCPECKYVYPKNERKGGGRNILGIDGDMEEVDVETIRAAREAEIVDAVEHRQKTGLSDNMERRLQHLMDVAMAKGVRSPAQWAARILTSELAMRETR